MLTAKSDICLEQCLQPCEGRKGLLWANYCIRIPLSVWGGEHNRFPKYKNLPLRGQLQNNTILMCMQSVKITLFSLVQSVYYPPGRLQMDSFIILLWTEPLLAWQSLTLSTSLHGLQHQLQSVSWLVNYDPAQLFRSSGKVCLLMLLTV